MRVPVVPLKEIVDRAFAERYGVAAINVVNDLTMEAVLAAAVRERSPVIIQTSVKTVRSIGLDLLSAMWREMTAGIEVVAEASTARKGMLDAACPGDVFAAPPMDYVLEIDELLGAPAEIAIRTF